MKLSIIYNILVCVVLVKVTEGLRCMSCRHVSDISACQLQLATCDNSTEECFFEVTTTTQLKTVYSAGCRANAVCNLMQSVDGRRRRSVSCSQCCNKDREDYLPCNGFLCGKTISEKNTCVSCEKTLDPRLCQNYVKCQPNEVCSQYQYISGRNIYYDLGCVRKDICRSFVAHAVLRQPKYAVGKRDTDICFACCNGINCNRNTCRDMRQNMTLAMLV